MVVVAVAVSGGIVGVIGVVGVVGGGVGASVLSIGAVVLLTIAVLLSTFLILCLIKQYGQFWMMFPDSDSWLMAIEDCKSQQQKRLQQ